MNRDANSSAFIDKYKDYKPGGTVSAPGPRHAICERCNIPDQMQVKGLESSKSPPALEDLSKAQAPSDSIREQIKRAVLEGERDKIETLIDRALLQEEIPALEIVNQALIPGIEQAGEMYDKKRYFLPPADDGSRNYESRLRLREATPIGGCSAKCGGHCYSYS